MSTLKYPSGNMSCILHANCMQAALCTLKTEGEIDMQIIFLSAELEAELHFNRCLSRIALFMLVVSLKICLIRPLPWNKYL
jgi:hypothetical protein